MSQLVVLAMGFLVGVGIVAGVNAIRRDSARPLTVPAQRVAEHPRSQPQPRPSASRPQPTQQAVPPRTPAQAPSPNARPPGQAYPTSNQVPKAVSPAPGTPSGGLVRSRSGGDAQQIVAHLETDDHRTQIPLEGEVTIGRGSDQTVRITDDRASRRHAVLRRRSSDGSWEVEDVGSANGTSLNGHRIPDGRVAPLRDGDRIGVGGTTLIYRAVTEQSADATKVIG